MCPSSSLSEFAAPPLASASERQKNLADSRLCIDAVVLEFSVRVLGFQRGSQEVIHQTFYCRGELFFMASRFRYHHVIRLIITTVFVLLPISVFAQTGGGGSASGTS